MTINPIVSAYIAENSKPGFDYLGDAAVALSSIDDARWPAVLEALDELNCGGTDPGIDCEVVKTYETFDDFDDARKKWAEKGSRSELEFSGVKALKFERFQLFRGQPRRKQIVLDLGDFRLCLL